MRKTIFLGLLLAMSLSSCKNQMGLTQMLDSIEGQTWLVEAINGVDINPEKYNFKGVPELTFADGGVLQGHTGCNGFRAKYKVADGKDLNIQPGPMTKMYCEGVDENGFMEAIDQTRNLKLDTNKLMFLSEQGQELLRLVKK